MTPENVWFKDGKPQFIDCKHKLIESMSGGCVACWSEYAQWLLERVDSDLLIESHESMSRFVAKHAKGGAIGDAPIRWSDRPPEQGGGYVLQWLDHSNGRHWREVPFVKGGKDGPP